MLRTSRSLASKLIFANKGIVIDGVVNNIKISKTKIKVKRSSKKNQKTAKFKTLLQSNNFSSKSTEQVFRSDFYISKTRLTFAKLRYVFVEVLIFYHFDSKFFIYIETNISNYVICKVLN